MLVDIGNHPLRCILPDQSISSENVQDRQSCSRDLYQVNGCTERDSSSEESWARGEKDLPAEIECVGVN